MTRKKSVKEDLKVYSNELNTVIHVKALKEKEFLTLFNKLIKYVKAVKSGEFDYISYIMPIIDNALPALERKEFDTRLLKYNDKSNPDANKIGKYRVYRAYYFAITNIYPLLGVEYVCSNLNESVADKFDINDILSEIEDDEDDDIFMEKPKPKPKKKAPAKKNKNASYSLVTASDIKEIEKFLKKNVIGQDEAIQTVTTALKLKAVGFADHVNLFFIGKTGVGKCFGKDTKIKMYNGSWKYVQYVQEGDLVMGDDSTPRVVSGVTKGRDELFRITPVKGDPYIVNKAHILCLKHTSTGNIVEISVEDYLNQSVTFKRLHKQYRVAVDYPERPLESFLDPYYVGLWVGDGSMNSTGITTLDEEVYDYLVGLAEEYKCKLSAKKSTKRCPTYSLVTDRGQPNHVLNELKSLGMHKQSEKIIPESYLRGSRETRLKLLAGLVDSDGSYYNNCFDFVTKYEKLADQVQELARSLGLWAHYKECEKSSQYGTKGTYYRMCISGDTSIVPCLVERKKCHERLQIKDVKNTGITVEAIGEGDYYGFVVDKNHRFLLEDFTVTHNTLLSKKLGEKYSGNTWVINCGELQNGHEINKFLGAPPGYIGSTEKSILREKAEISNKWVIIFDEIEKAHPKFYNFVLALTDTGTATDSMGYEADFTDSIFIFTSNCGVSDIKNSTINWKSTRTQNTDKEEILKALEVQFSPEFRGRIDEFVFFNNLNQNDIRIIVSDMLRKLPIVVTDELVEFVIAKGYSEEYGVRDVNRVVKNLVKHPLAEAILDNRLPKSTGLNFDLAINDGKVQVVNTIGLSK